MGGEHNPRPLCLTGSPRAPKGGVTCNSTASPRPLGTEPGLVAKDTVPLDDQDAGTQRRISLSSSEFKKNYVDHNIVSAQFWDTPFANQDPKYKEFTVEYADGRTLTFRVGEIPVRHAINTQPGMRQARILFKPQRYIKRGGFIYPDLYGEGSVPRLIDIATTVELNHRRREQFLEIAALTFQFATILSSYAAPPAMKSPAGRTASGGLKLRGLKPAVRRVTWQDLAEWEQLELAETGSRIPRKLREGGHLLGHHVHITDQALQSRAAAVTEKVATKFSNADLPVRCINKTLDRNWSRIQTFLAERKPGEAEFLELVETMDEAVGYGFRAMPDGSFLKLEGLRDVAVWLQADGVGGWLIRTAFPVP